MGIVSGRVALLPRSTEIQPFVALIRPSPPNLIPSRSFTRPDHGVPSWGTWCAELNTWSCHPPRETWHNRGLGGMSVSFALLVTPGTCSISCGVVPSMLKFSVKNTKWKWPKKLSPSQTCVGALGTFDNVGHPCCEVIGQYRNQGASDVKEHRAPSTTLVAKHWAKKVSLFQRYECGLVAKRRLCESAFILLNNWTVMSAFVCHCWCGCSYRIGDGLFVGVRCLRLDKYVNPIILGSLSYVHQDRFYSLGKINVGKAIGELVAIDWKDRNGGWTEFMRLKIKINVSCPLRRVVRLVGRDGAEIICMIKAIAVAPHQNRAIWRNGIEMVATPTSLNDANDE
ncbi:hypothetical protein Goshw_027048, partial [Gossypium schwendimanii]|nr:hypothetical protein [Gossypium schwendimanii]